jgi:ubiquitin-protein ligase
MSHSEETPRKTRISYIIPDDANTYELDISLLDSPSEVLRSVRERHSCHDLFHWAVNSPSDIQRDDQTFKSVHKPGNVYHFLPRMLDVKFVYETKPKAKSGWERVKLTDTMVFAELIELGPPGLPRQNIDRIEINDIAVSLDARFIDYVTDLSQPVRSLRLFPAGVPVTFDVVMVTANGFLRRKLEFPPSASFQDVVDSDVRRDLVARIRERTKFEVMQGCFWIHVFDAEGRPVQKLRTVSQRLLYVIAFIAQVSADSVIADVGNLYAENFPASASVFAGPWVMELCAWLAYVARRGYKSQALLRQFGRYIPFVPFLLSFAKLAAGEKVTQLDVAIIMDTLASFLTCAQPGVNSRDMFTAFGYVFSNLIAGDIGPELPIRREDWTWEGRNWTCDEVIPALTTPTGGVFDPVPLSDSGNLTTMRIIRRDSRRAYLFIAKDDRGYSCVYAPQQATSAWELRQITELPTNLDAFDQAIVVLIDDSGSMRSVAPTMQKRKIDAAIDLAQAFFRAADHYGPPAVYGVATFSGARDVKLAAAIPVIQPMQGHGKTLLWKAISAIVGVFAANKNLARMRKRILVLTDGEDVTHDDQIAVCRSVLSENVVIDAILLETSGDALDAKLIAAILPFAFHSGGCCFYPRSTEEAVRFIQKEEFVDTSLRKVERRSSAVPIENAEFESVLKWLAFSQKVPVALRWSHSATLLTFERTVFEHADAKSCRVRRILDEMQICVENGFIVYSHEKSIGEWRVFLPRDLNGRRVYWDLLVQFRHDYPYSPPVFRFLSIPPLANVSPIGRVRSTLIERYHMRFHIATILLSIRRLFDEPDPATPSLDPQEGPAWDPSHYDTLIAQVVEHPWLPLPEVNYLAVFGGTILGGSAPVPPRKKKAGLEPRTYSQMSGRKTDRPINVNGIVLHPDEAVWFQTPDSVGR